MSLNAEFKEFARQELDIPLVGVLPPDDIAQEDVERITPVLELFERSTPLAAGSGFVLNARDFLPEARSIIVTGTPGYFGRMRSLESCRETLRGRAEPSHVNISYSLHNQEKGYRLAEFFTKRGHAFSSLVGQQFPIKLAASKCGVGFYGKNAVIQHPDHGAWITLMAYVTDAGLEPDDPLNEKCPDDCVLCLKACPTGALVAPYRCDASRCIDFNLGHNKKNIPVEIRRRCGNLLGEGCTACRDACPKNRDLKTVSGFELPEDLMYPRLPDIFALTDEAWEEHYALTLMGFFLMEKRYLFRNAVIGLGNFKDERGVPVLSEQLGGGDEVLRGYAAWALGRIGGRSARQSLESALAKETDPGVRQEIETALQSG